MTRRDLLGLAAASLAAADPPRPAGPFSIRMLNGPRVPLAKFRGKAVVLYLMSPG